MDTNDTILLQRFRKGTDAEAFSQIVNLYAGIVYGACSRIIRDKDQARDVAQDTFFQLFRNASQVSGSLAGWLHTVATRKAIDIVRQDSARKAHHLEYSKSKLQQAENWDEISPYIDEALTQIDDQLRQILVKHFLEGLTMKETAEKMDISQATISRKVQAGLNEVRAILKKRGILVAAISLSALLTQNAAHAAPAALITQLGKMSIAAGATAAAASTAKAATAATVLTTIKAKVVTAVAVAAIGTGAVVTYNNVTNEPPSEPQTNQTAAIADETPTTTKTTTPSINSSDKQWQTFWNEVETEEQIQTPEPEPKIAEEYQQEKPEQIPQQPPTAETPAKPATRSTRGTGGGMRVTRRRRPANSEEQNENQQYYGGGMGGSRVRTRSRSKPTE